MVSVHDLISRKDYAKALQVLSAELKKSPHDQRSRLKYGDVLIMAGRQKEAVKVFLDLADHHTKDGFTAKAIAILKRVEKIEPNRSDVKGRLENLIHQKVNAAPSVPAAPGGGGGFEFGFEEIDAAAPEISLATEPFSAQAPPEPLDGGADDLAGIEIEPDPEPPPEAKSFLQSPLFEGFTDDEMMAVIEGLNLATFEPGDVIVAEGAPGDSMFILTEGLMKVHVRDPKGHYMMVQELGEGEFIGEVSVITGKPRTATITAAAECELLELDKPTLDQIISKHPRVKDILKDFHEKRAADTVHAIIKSTKG